MISAVNLNTRKAENLMYFFDDRMKELLKDPANFEDFNDEQMELLENNILPSVRAILTERSEEVPSEHT